VAPEPAGVSPYLQQPATGPYPEPTGSTLHPLFDLLKIHSDPILPSTPRYPEWTLSFGFSHQTPVHFPLLSHACHMSRPPNSPLFDLPNNICGQIQIMKILIVQLPSFFCYFIPVRSKYFSQNPVLKHPLNVRDQVSHLFKTSDTIMVLYNLISCLINHGLMRNV
jgi:hypothetical protein